MILRLFKDDGQVIKRSKLLFFLAAAVVLTACMDSSSPRSGPERSTVPIGTETRPEEVLPEPESDDPLLAKISLPLSAVRC